jgi:hypothetical protein
VRARGLLLPGLGVLLLGVGVLLPTVVVPRLETVPDDPDATVVLRAEDALVLDPSSQTTITTGLTLTSHTAGFSGSGAPPAGVAQWATNSRIVSDDGAVRSETWEIQAFDAHNGRASSCCAGFRITTDGRSVPVERSGIVLKFPFGTRPVDQQVWDPALGAATTATYVGEAEVGGVRAFEFRTEIPPTEVDEVTVPAAFMGIDSVRRVRVRQVYSGGRTMWVEPNTGGFLDLRQQVRQELVGLGRAAGRRTVAMDASFVLTAESRADAVDQWGQGVQLGRMHRTYPVVLGALGILVLALAAGLRRRRTPTG